MNTYSLLLVDDEEEVTQVIERKIDWDKLGFCVIGHANNGLKALEMIEEFQPDVVMTALYGRDAALWRNQKPISDNKNFVIYRL